MSIRIIETKRGPCKTGNDPSAEITYWVRATGKDRDNELDIRATVSANAPGLYDGLYQREVSIEERKPMGIYGVTVTYGQFTIQWESDGMLRRQFTTRGGTQHITHSLATRHRYTSSGDNGPDCGGAIGFDGENIQGCDIIVPVYSWNETWAYKVSDFTGSYQGKIFYLGGRKNMASWRTFTAGEVLFEGIDGGQEMSNKEKVEVTYFFRAAPNVIQGKFPDGRPLKIGDITVTECRGQDYVWMRPETTEYTSPGGGGSWKVTKAVCAYVEEVAHDGDFSVLKCI